MSTPGLVDLDRYQGAARALWRTVEDPDWCWADQPAGLEIRECRRPGDSTLGLCGTHRVEIIGPLPSPVPAGRSV